MEVAYVAQTEGCVFLLDGDGFCRATVPSPDADDAARKIAQRCIDAQYVASLDLTAEGLLVSEPKAGRQMLFAKVNAEGKVALIRTGSLLEMRSLDGPMPVIAAPVPETIALDEDPDEEIPVNHPEPADDCAELTAPFSRERPLLVSAVVPATTPVLADLAGEDDNDLTRDDFTRIVDRESQNDNGDVDLDDLDDLDNAKTGERASAPESVPAISAGPVTVAAPRTVRGFPPPPPPIPIVSRRGILPRRA